MLRSARILFLAALPLSFAAVGCSSNNANNASTATTAGAAASTTAGSGASAAGDVAVTIQDFKFGPDPVVVKAGQTITFTNKDDSPHEPTAGTPTKTTGTFSVDTAAHAGATTGPIQLAPGSYDYFCALHEYMVAKITVQ